MQISFQQCDPADISWLSEYLDFSSLPLANDNDFSSANPPGFILRWDDKGLSLQASADHGNTPTRVDFLSSRIRHRLVTSKKNAGLLKAVGLDKVRATLQILDATAGLGVDGFILAAMGCQVTLLEKSPVMAALLADGLRRGLASGDHTVASAVSRMTLVHTDAQEFLQQLPANEGPDVITLDPMYPPRQKTAKVKKNMALMQTLLPANEDIDTLLLAARDKARRRVVLKRPGKLTKDATHKPDFQVPGKSSHFQVFMTQ